ncbi:hypothetical protein [Actinokineospora sp.]|uniref:hypothetical protein n=1 Tax=Actinokineospora sp. TaxID=1872133 RepID=UPI0040384C60
MIEEDKITGADSTVTVYRGPLRPLGQNVIFESPPHMIYPVSHVTDDYATVQRLENDEQTKLVKIVGHPGHA